MWMKLFRQIDMTGNPLLLLTVFFAIVGIQFLSLGLLGEMCAWIYFESQDKQPYAVRRLVNIELVKGTSKSLSPRRQEELGDRS